jgi:hypothetical protein
MLSCGQRLACVAQINQPWSLPARRTRLKAPHAFFIQPWPCLLKKLALSAALTSRPPWASGSEKECPSEGGKDSVIEFAIVELQYIEFEPCEGTHFTGSQSGI